MTKEIEELKKTNIQHRLKLQKSEENYLNIHEEAMKTKEQLTDLKNKYHLETNKLSNENETYSNNIIHYNNRIIYFLY